MQLKNNIQELESKFWYKGWALDYHSIYSNPNPYGGFDTKRTEIGEALYSLKYCDNRNQLEPIATTASTFILSAQNEWWFQFVKAIIPVPPSVNTRRFQPVLELARLISQKLEIKCDEDYLLKVKQTEQLKNVGNQQDRFKQLRGAFKVKKMRYFFGTILVFDDIYGSGSTLETICRIIKDKGNVRFIYVLTITRKR
jgi:predicted amidophosphoribosyltransferase